MKVCSLKLHLNEPDLNMFGIRHFDARWKAEIMLINMSQRKMERSNGPNPSVLPLLFHFY